MSCQALLSTGVFNMPVDNKYLYLPKCIREEVADLVTNQVPLKRVPHRVATHCGPFACLGVLDVADAPIHE